MQSHPEILLAVVLLPMLAGWIAARYLSLPLSRMLVEECGTEERADFWSRLTVVGMMVAPTALALMRAGAWGPWLDPVEVARALLSVSLNGVLAVLGVLAFAVWRRIPQRPGKAAGSSS
jgi:hypothetical protein